MTSISSGDVPARTLAWLGIELVAGGCLLPLSLAFHFHQFVVEVLREIRIISIADIDQPVNQITD